MSGTGQPVVIYDLDGVVTRKDSFTALLLYRLRTSPVRLVLTLPRAILWACARHSYDRARAARNIAARALRGMTDDEYTNLARSMGKRLGRDPNWIRQDMVERIQRQYAAGDHIVLATASEQRLAEALLEYAGVAYHTLSATQLRTTSAGITVQDHRIGHRKAQALEELGVPIADAEFVTDSATDLPTARLARQVTLVSTSRSTIRRFSAEGFTLSIWLD